MKSASFEYPNYGYSRQAISMRTSYDENDQNHSSVIDSNNCECRDSCNDLH